MHERALPRLRLRSPTGDALRQALQALQGIVLLSLEPLNGLRAGGDQRLALLKQLRTTRLGALGLIPLGLQAGMANPMPVQCLLRLLSLKQGLRNAVRCTLQAMQPRIQANLLRIQPSQLLPDGRQPGLDQFGGVIGLLPQGTDFFLAEQVGKQALDLGIAVGAELALALR